MMALNPYDHGAIPGSILEDYNFDPKTSKQRQLWRPAISAKQYALFVRDRRGEPALLREGVNSKEGPWHSCCFKVPYCGIEPRLRSSSRKAYTEEPFAMKSVRPTITGAEQVKIEGNFIACSTFPSDA